MLINRDIVVTVKENKLLLLLYYYNPVLCLDLVPWTRACYHF